MDALAAGDYVCVKEEWTYNQTCLSLHVHGKYASSRFIHEHQTDMNICMGWLVACIAVGMGVLQHN